jgi:hypothetical protein
MSEKMYILSVSGGSWDNYYHINLGVFDDENKANKAGDEFLEIRKNLIENLESGCPVDLSLHKKIYDDFDTELLDSLDETTVSKYYEWSYKLSRAKDINNEYRVEPVWLNTINISDIIGTNIT